MTHAKKALPTKEELEAYVRYEPETGKLFWLRRSRDLFKSEGHWKTWNTKYAGKEALAFTDRRGYRCGGFKGINYRTHRLIWRLVTGDEPCEIDHINGDPSDNRWSNLRNVTRSENNKNQRARVDSKSGHVGVYWHSSQKAWAARVNVNGCDTHLGCFEKIEDAIAARRSASERYGYHENHGRRV